MALCHCQTRCSKVSKEMAGTFLGVFQNTQYPKMSFMTLNTVPSPYAGPAVQKETLHPTSLAMLVYTKFWHTELSQAIRQIGDYKPMSW